MFKIGQKVVCKTYTENGNLKQGEIYTVVAVNNCYNCSKQRVDVGVDDSKFRRATCSCGATHFETNFYGAWRFEPLKYDIIPNSEIIKEMIIERSDVPIKEPKKVKKVVENI